MKGGCEPLYFSPAPSLVSYRFWKGGGIRFDANLNPSPSLNGVLHPDRQLARRTLPLRGRFLSCLFCFVFSVRGQTLGISIMDTFEN